MSSCYRYGTHHFQSVRAAERYYAQYGYGDVKRAVQLKIADGEIEIGRPKTLPDSAVFRWDADGRGEVTEPAPRK